MNEGSNKEVLYGIFIRRKTNELKNVPVPCWLLVTKEQFPVIPAGYCRFDKVLKKAPAIHNGVRQQLISAAQAKAEKMMPAITLTIGRPPKIT